MRVGPRAESESSAGANPLSPSASVRNCEEAVAVRRNAAASYSWQTRGALNALYASGRAKPAQESGAACTMMGRGTPARRLRTVL